MLHPSSRNYKIRTLFQKELVTTPYVVSYWKIVVDHIDWNKVWTLPSKYIITNKVREISFKSLHRFYPAKVFLKRFKSDIDTSCSFCGGSFSDFAAVGIEHSPSGQRRTGPRLSLHSKKKVVERT